MARTVFYTATTLDGFLATTDHSLQPHLWATLERR